MKSGVSVLLRQCIEQSGMKAAEIARRAGVSASTISRIVNGQVSPSVATVAEIVAACNSQLNIVATKPHGPQAAAAARLMLDEEYEGDVKGLELWVERLSRWNQDDPVSMVTSAGEHSGVMQRAGSFYLRGQITMGRLASAGAASERQWAISGAAGQSLPSFSQEVPPATVLWCEDPLQVSRLLVGGQITEASAPHRARVIVAPAEPQLFSGSFKHDRISYASPIQIAIDCISIGGPAREAALKEVAAW